MELAMLGLGKMGKNMAIHLKEKGHDVLCWNRSEGPRNEVAEKGCRVIEDHMQVAGNLSSSPRIVWIQASEFRFIVYFFEINH